MLLDDAPCTLLLHQLAQIMLKPPVPRKSWLSCDRNTGDGAPAKNHVFS